MIANITKGRKAYGGLAYDFGPGRHDEHVDPRIVASTIPGTWQQVARTIDHHLGYRPEIRKAVWRCSLSLPDEDGVLPDRQWAEIAKQFVEGMGFGNCDWVAVRHGQDHVHLTVARVDWDGVLVTDRWDRPKARRVADQIERAHGLVPARSRFRKAGPGVQSGSELAAARRRGVEPEREKVRRLVREARQAAAGRGEEVFEQHLAGLGVLFKANRASTGRMNGYSFSLPGWQARGGVPVFVKASEVAPDLAWSKLSPVLARQDPPAPGDAAPAPAPGPVPPAPQATRQGQARQAADAPAPDPAAQLLAHYRDAAAAIADTEPAPRPVPADPARRLLEQYTARAQQQPAQDEHQAVPATPAWAERPAGELNDQQLATRVTAARGRAQQLLAELAARREDVVRWERAVTGEGGEGTAALERQLQALREAADLHRRAAEFRALAAEQQTLAQGLRRAESEAAKKSRRSKLVLAVVGTTKEAEAALAEEAGRRAKVAEALRDTAQQEAADALHGALAAAPGVADPGAELIKMTSNLPALAAQARAQDSQQRGAAVAWLENARQAAISTERQLDQAVAALRPLAAEDRLRAGRTPEQNRAEDAERIQARRTKAAHLRSTTVSRPPAPGTAKGTKPVKGTTAHPAPRRTDPPGQDQGRGRGR
ncbi:relaxase/mobilization nuclease domain-containing protein [Kitasatospora sp. NPDC086801]|uniref:relaxase/mobilization nuclease domain-containing protein n=1 Tax=Kitasatospora sp. NPDC086801 TaxID=3364066 RepID=UPI003820C12D